MFIFIIIILWIISLISSIRLGIKLIVNELVKLNRINTEEVLKFSSWKYLINKIKEF